MSEPVDPIATLKRRGRLERFSLETLLRFPTRAGMRIELRAVRAPYRDRGASIAVE